MKLFTIDENGKLTPYTQRVFNNSNQEADFEVLLENNPEYFFEGSNVLIIGRQVSTNLNTFIDLLGIDKSGNTVVILRSNSNSANVVSNTQQKGIVGEHVQSH